MQRFKLNEDIIIAPLYKGAIISNSSETSINYINEAGAVFLELCQMDFNFDESFVCKHRSMITDLMEKRILV